MSEQYQSDPGTLQRLQNIFLLDERTIEQQLDPDFNRYFREFLHDPASFETYIEEIRYLAQVGGLAGHVLDLAAGFGVTAICLRGLGIDTVSCLDLVETKVITARKLAQKIAVTGCSFRLGDAAAIPFPDCSFDGVLIKDAASHFNDPPKVYAEVARVLKRNGQLVIFDDRNARSSCVQSQTLKVWETSESGSRDALATLGMTKPFMQMRREYILQHFVGIGEQQASTIADQTRGYTFEMLNHVVPAMLEGRPVGLKAIAPCVNPENGIVQERLIDPIDLSRELSTLGFDAIVSPPPRWDPDNYRRQGGNLSGVLVRLLIRMVWPTQRFWPFGVRYMGQFVIAGKKR